MASKQGDDDFVPETRKYTYKRWTDSENRAYACFLKSSEKAESEGAQNLRKPRRFFVKMAAYLGGRKTNEQCRTHHQKMTKAFGSIENIIEKYGDAKDVPTSSTLIATTEELPLEET